MKVATFGGATFPYLVGVAASLGWSISIALTSPTVLSISVYLSESPSYQAVGGSPPLAGLLLAGQQLNCEPDISQLTCAFDRILHGHLTVTYTTIS